MDSISAITGKTPVSRTIQTQQVSPVGGEHDVDPVGNAGKFEAAGEGQSIHSTRQHTPVPQESKNEVQSVAQFQDEVSRTRIMKSQGLMTFSTTKESQSNGGVLGGVKQALIEGADKKKAYDAKMKELASGELTTAKVIQMQGLTYNNSNEISFMNALIKRGVTIVQDLTKG